MSEVNSKKLNVEVMSYEKLKELDLSSLYDICGRFFEDEISHVFQSPEKLQMLIDIYSLCREIKSNNFNISNNPLDDDCYSDNILLLDCLYYFIKVAGKSFNSLYKIPALKNDLNQEVKQSVWVDDYLTISPLNVFFQTINKNTYKEIISANKDFTKIYTKYIKEKLSSFDVVAEDVVNYIGYQNDLMFKMKMDFSKQTSGLPDNVLKEITSKLFYWGVNYIDQDIHKQVTKKSQSKSYFDCDVEYKILDSMFLSMMMEKSNQKNNSAKTRLTKF